MIKHLIYDASVPGSKSESPLDHQEVFLHYKYLHFELHLIALVSTRNRTENPIHYVRRPSSLWNVLCHQYYYLLHITNKYIIRNRIRVRLGLRLFIKA